MTATRSADTLQPIAEELAQALAQLLRPTDIGFVLLLTRCDDCVAIDSAAVSDLPTQDALNTLRAALAALEQRAAAERPH